MGLTDHYQSYCHVKLELYRHYGKDLVCKRDPSHPLTESYRRVNPFMGNWKFVMKKHDIGIITFNMSQVKTLTQLQIRGISSPTSTFG